MSQPSVLRLRSDLAGAPAYRPGRSQLGSGGPVHKLSSNENPYPPLASVVGAVVEALSTANRYPNSAATPLAEALARRYGVESANLAFGAGSVDVIAQLIRATSGPGDEVVFAWRSFEAYPLLVHAAGVAAVQVPLLPDHRHDLPAMLAAVTERTRLVMVCTPNNPTGTTVGQAELERFLDALPPSVVVLVDEAYFHFDRSEGSAVGIDLFHRYPNVVVAHTFSKAYGLAGLRVGYAIAPTDVIGAMRSVSTPFAVTDLAQTAALASLEAEAELAQRVDALVAERTRLLSALTRDGWRLPASEGNFLWFPLGEHSADAMAAFEERNVLVRGFPGEGVRVTVDEPEANDLVLAVAATLVERSLTGTAHDGEGAREAVPVPASAGAR